MWSCMCSAVHVETVLTFCFICECLLVFAIYARMAGLRAAGELPTQSPTWQGEHWITDMCIGPGGLKSSLNGSSLPTELSPQPYKAVFREAVCIMAT